LDKIAIIVDHTVITEMQLDEELRVTAFLNQEPVNRDTAARQAAARRLIEQELVRQEVLATQYLPPSTARVDQLYADTEKDYGGAKSMAKALDKYGLNEAILKDHLRGQLTILGFVDLRFRPDVEVSEQDVTEYYNKKVAEWRKTHQGAPPTLNENRAAIEKSLTNERSEYALSLWLKEARKDANIVYLDKALAER
jgi:parvulin-like peptidyl-prolyl isomerase